MKFRLIAFDIDGVLTDGKVSIDAAGVERKNVSLRTLDAIASMHQDGYLVVAITGEQSEIVTYFRNRIKWDAFRSGRKDKAKALHEILNEFDVRPEETIYIGDGKYDVEALTLAGLGVCPADACLAAKNAADIVLESSGGECVDELLHFVQKLNLSGDMRNEYLQRRIAEHVHACQKLATDAVLLEHIMDLCKEAVMVIERGNKILLCGNGGSAADAQHIAAEFIGRFFLERRAINAEALTTNTSILTSLSNDYSYDVIFARQVEAKACAGDLLIGLSTSGESKNVLEAFRVAKTMGVKTAMLMGDFDCPISEEFDHIIQVPSKSTPRIQELHIFIGHVLAEYVEEKLYKNQK